jgi:hypothetical protein
MHIERVGDTPHYWFVADGRRFPVMHWRVSSFAGIEGRGVLIRLESGWDVSVIWDSLTYSSNRYRPGPGGDFIEDPDEVEIAVFKAGEGLVHLTDEESTIGYVPATQVRRFIDWFNRHTVFDATSFWSHFKAIPCDGNGRPLVVES